MPSIWVIPADIWLTIDEFADLRRFASTCRRARELDVARSLSLRSRGMGDPLGWFLRHHADGVANLAVRCEASPTWLTPAVIACSRLTRLELRSGEYRIDVGALAAALQRRPSPLKHFTLSMCCTEGLVVSEMARLHHAVAQSEFVRLRLVMCQITDALLSGMAEAIAAEAVPRWQTYRLSLKHNEGVSVRHGARGRTGPRAEPDRGVRPLVALWERCPWLTEVRLNASYTAVTHGTLRGLYRLPRLTAVVVKIDKDVFDDGLIDGASALSGWNPTCLRRWEWSMAYHTIHSVPAAPASAPEGCLRTFALDTEGCQWDTPALSGHRPPDRDAGARSQEPSCRTSRRPCGCSGCDWHAATPRCWTAPRTPSGACRTWRHWCSASRATT
jgi:hypothetical protein